MRLPRRCDLPKRPPRVELCSLLGDDGGRCHHFLRPRARAHTSVTSQLRVVVAARVAAGIREEGDLEPPWVPCEEARGVFVDEAVVAHQQHRVLNPSPPPPCPSSPSPPVSAVVCLFLLTTLDNGGKRLLKRQFTLCCCCSVRREVES